MRKGRHRERTAWPNSPVVFYSYGGTFSRTGYPSRYDAMLVTSEFLSEWQRMLSEKRH